MAAPPRRPPAGNRALPGSLPRRTEPRSPDSSKETDAEYFRLAGVVGQRLPVTAELDLARQRDPVLAVLAEDAAVVKSEPPAENLKIAPTAQAGVAAHGPEGKTDDDRAANARPHDVEIVG